MAARRAPWLVLLGVAACAQLVADSGPRPQTVIPAGAYRGQEVRVRIAGTGYEVRGVQHLGGGGEVSAQFEVRIGGVALTDVHYLEGDGAPDIVEGTVPSDLPLGVHDVEVRDPYGRVGVLRGAFTESEHSAPVLSAALTAPPRVEAGVPFLADVTNAGGSDARLSSLAVGNVDAGMAGLLLPAGGSLRFQVGTTVSGRGPSSLQLQATAMDPVTGLALAPVQASAPILALAPPSLVASLDPTPATIDVGQTFTATLLVTNEGDVDALSVLPELMPDPIFSPGSVTLQDVPAGESRTFAADLQGIAASSGSFEIFVSGQDQLTSVPVASAPVRSPSIAVVEGASLSAGAPALPAVLSRGQAFTVSLTVANAGPISGQLDFWERRD